MYLTATRPDLMYGVSLISRFISYPTESYWLAAKRLLRYAKGTTKLGILYKKGECSDLVAYMDSDFNGDLNDRTSILGFVFLLSSGVISWSSKKQSVVTLSTTEIEYIAARYSVCQYIWLRRMLKQLCHIDIRFHFLIDLTEDKVVELSYCNSQDQVADIIIKYLKLEQFLRLLRMLEIVDVSVVN